MNEIATAAALGNVAVFVRLREGEVMCRILAFGLGIALGIAPATTRAADPATPTPSKSVFAKLNPFSSSKPEQPAETKVAKQFAVGPLSIEAKNEAVSKEREAYFRRMQVCMELRKVAMDTGDEQLLQQADRLDALALQTYKTRISRFGVKMPESAAMQNLDRQLGAGIATTPLTSGIRGPSDTTTSRPATAQVRNFREVAP